MAYTVDDGPPDIDAVHLWTPATTSPASPIPPVLNFKAVDFVTTQTWVKVLRIPGWRTLPESPNFKHPRTYGVGTYPEPSRKLDKTVVYVCEVRSEDDISCRRMLNECIQGFGFNMSDEGSMQVDPFDDIGGPTWTFTGRVINLDPDELFTYSRHRISKFRWGFTLSINMHNPYFYTDGDPYL